MSGWHVTASAIDHWTASNRRQAQETLPLLVRHLITATVKLTHINMPVGDSILLGGWDGVLEVKEGNMFVPSGLSAWELGTDRNVKAKAERDYQKRTKNPKGLTKSDTTFVFVTSRSFATRDHWIAVKRKRTKWKEVRALNASDIEAWLEQAPAVHRWFARKIGKRPAGAWDLAKAWEEWSRATDPPCNDALVLAGREDSLTLLQRGLRGSASILCVRGESSEESYAFALAALRASPIFSPKVLIVTDPKEWDELVESLQPLILIPRFSEQRSYGLAIDRGHHVIRVDSKQTLGSTEKGIVLSKTQPEKLSEALIAMGFSKDAAEEVIKASRCQITVVRRHPALHPGKTQQPAWAQPGHAELLVPAMLAGSWRSDNEADRQQLARLSEMDYSEYERLLYRWVVQDDPPVRLVGTVWQLVSRPDAWSLLNRSVSAPVLDRLGEVIHEVFGEIDPRFELPPEERVFANIKGKIPKHSPALRSGLAETLAMLGAYGDEDCTHIRPVTVQDRVNHWVYRLLTEDASELRWRSLARQLQRLAEGAPEQFLTATEKGLQGDSPVVLSLFEGQGQMGECLHADLLWALEALSWNADLLPRVVRLLARLSRLDPGGRSANRPSASLKEIFLGWNPQTTLPLERRMAILDSLLCHEPNEGWRLLLALLPIAAGEISRPICKPMYRSWAQGWQSGVTRAEYFKHYHEVAERVLAHVDKDGNSRWPELLEYLPRLPKPLFESAIEKLSSFGEKEVSEETRNPISNGLRKLISRHREFADAAWAMPGDALDRLEGVFQKFLPQDLVQRHMYLFDEHFPTLLTSYRKKDFKEQSQFISQAREEALQEVWSEGGLENVERLAVDAKLPWTIGHTLAKAPFSSEIEGNILSWLSLDGTTTLSKCAEAYVASRASADTTWATRVKEQYFAEWSEDKLAALCLGLPFSARTFELLEELGDRVSQGYWKKVRRCLLDDEDSKHASWVLDQLLKHGRPLTAIDTAALYLHGSARQVGLDSDVLARALETAAQTPTDEPGVSLSSLAFDICEIIKHLQTAGGLNETRLMRIEWMYIQLLDHSPTEPTTLIRAVLRDPENFIELICMMFKPEVPQPDEETKQVPLEHRQRQAKNAWDLLRLISKIPGQQNGDVDKSLLASWIQQAREGCFKKSRGVIGDQQIGQILSFSPVGVDGMWPHEAVRDLLESLENEHIELGMEIGRSNQRGVTCRALGEGGEQERKLAEKYQNAARALQDNWPRTAAMLMRMASGYRREAAHEDHHADLTDGLI